MHLHRHTWSRAARRHRACSSPRACCPCPRRPRVPTALRPAPAARLTNLAHLDFLRRQVTPRRRPATRRTGSRSSPRIGVLWTYADRNADGTLPTRVGGGTYDAATDTYGQGAFNADDMARAAVVYLRHWQQTGATSSRDAAYEMLRGLTYLQTAIRPERRQRRALDAARRHPEPERRSGRAARPVGQRRVLLAGPHGLGAGGGLRRLPDGRPGLRAFPPATGSTSRSRARRPRRCSTPTASTTDVDGRRTPAWLIADGADASAEAVLGLAAYVRAGGDRRRAARAGASSARASPSCAGGDARHWPFGGGAAVGASRSATGTPGPRRCPAALAAAGRRLGDRGACAGRHCRDSFTFTRGCSPRAARTTAGAPTRTDGTQIAYGVDSRVQSLIALAGRSDDGSATGRSARRHRRRLVLRGERVAGSPTYDPATGVTIDGIAADGTVNRNSGAESTIHGLLTMLALDAHPAVAQHRDRSRPRCGRGRARSTSRPRTARSPAAPRPWSASAFWTGEPQYGGSGYASLRGPAAAATLRPRRAPALAGDPGRRPAARQPARHHVQRRRPPLGAIRSGHRPPGRLPRAGRAAAA